MQRKLRNLSRQTPLTPRILEPAQPSCARTTPDLKFEAALYAALCFERQRNAELTKQIKNRERAFTDFRAKGVARGIAKGMKPEGLERPARKGKL
jgi:hypothetical protein